MTREWDSTIARLPAEAASSLWRGYCDAVQGGLLGHWLAGRRFRRALKTDAWDEATGEGLVPVLPRFATAVAWMDCSLCVLDRARRRHGPLTLVAADVRRLPFASETFDLVFSGSTLDHFGAAGEIQAALAEIARVLARGGILVLTLDNPLNPVVALRNALPDGLRRALRITPYPVGKTLGPRRLREALREAGLEVVWTSAIAHFPRWPAVWLCRWL
ncbi:MAG: class I SAM-dependent methyltransferase, partial [Bryobacteraceae bacterium]